MAKPIKFLAEREHYCSPYFVLVANDQELLADLNRLFRRQGFISVVTRANQQVFYINSQQATSKISSEILHFMQEQNFIWPQVANNYACFCQARRKLIHAVLHKFNFDESLLGYAILKYIAEHLDCPPKDLKPFKQKIYPQAASYFAVSINQVNRAVNYVLRKANYVGNTLDIFNVIYCYLNELARHPELVKKLGTSRADLTKLEALTLLSILAPKFRDKNLENSEISSELAA